MRKMDYGLCNFPVKTDPYWTNLVVMYVSICTHVYIHNVCVYIQKCTHIMCMYMYVYYACKCTVLQPKSARPSVLHQRVSFQVYGIGKFLDSLKPHLIALVFSSLANVYLWFKGQNLTRLMCTRSLHKTRKYASYVT